MLCVAPVMALRSCVESPALKAAPNASVHSSLFIARRVVCTSFTQPAPRGGCRSVHSLHRLQVCSCRARRVYLRCRAICSGESRKNRTAFS